jgi:hypothetical protein
VALQTKGLGAGQTDPVQPIIIDVCNRIRSEIAGNKNSISLSLTPSAIPPSVFWVAACLIVEQAQVRLPEFNIFAGEGHADVIKDAHDYLKRINAGDILVEEPLDPEPTSEFQSPSAAVVVTYTEKKFTRSSLQGL